MLAKTPCEPVPVFEPATSETLFPRGYLAANADLRRAFGDDEPRAVTHFHQFGHREGRHQVTPWFLDGGAASTQAAKFARFRDCFAALPGDATAFPIHFGSASETLADYEGESAHPTPHGWDDELKANPDKLYADIGAGLRSEVYDNCLYVEVYPSLTTDVVIEPTCKLPFTDACLDGIGCFAVLEHVREPWLMAAEFARVVRPGGKIFIDWPFLVPVHGYPSHYYNATREGLRAMFAGAFEVAELATHPHQTPAFTVHWILSVLLAKCPELASRTVADLVREQPYGPWWRSIMAQLDDDTIATLACGNRLVGVRRQASGKSSNGR